LINSKQGIIAAIIFREAIANGTTNIVRKIFLESTKNRALASNGARIYGRIVASGTTSYARTAIGSNGRALHGAIAQRGW